MVRKDDFSAKQHVQPQAQSFLAQVPPPLIAYDMMLDSEH